MQAAKPDEKVADAGKSASTGAPSSGTSAMPGSSDDSVIKGSVIMASHGSEAEGGGYQGQSEGGHGHAVRYR